jgi:Na+/proline symporter
MSENLVYTGVVLSVIITIGLTILGVRSVNENDTSSRLNFFLLSKSLTTSELVAALISTNTALALIIFWFSYLGWLYGVGAIFWISLCWIAGFEVFAFFQKRWDDFPSPQTDGDIKYKTLHRYIAPENGDSARIALATISIVSFLLMLSIELTRGMKIIDISSFSNNANVRDMLAFIIVFAIAIYAAWGGFKAAVKTDFYQIAFTLAALITICFITLPDIIGQEDLFGSVYSPESASLKSFFLIPTQPYFILGSLFSWSFWFFVTMDTWQRMASARKIEMVTTKTRTIFYTWFIILSIVSVSIGLYVRTNLPAEFNISFPVIDFLSIAFGQEWNSIILKYIAFSTIFVGFTTAMLSTIDTFLLVIAHSIFEDMPNVPAPQNTISFNRILAGVVILGIVFVLFPLFLLVYHADLNINSLMYLATSLPFALLTAIIFREKREQKNLNIILSVFIGAFGCFGSTYYILYKITSALPSELSQLYNIMYFIPLFTFIASYVGYKTADFLKTR